MLSMGRFMVELSVYAVVLTLTSCSSEKCSPDVEPDETASHDSSVFEMTGNRGWTNGTFVDGSSPLVAPVSCNEGDQLRPRVGFLPDFKRFVMVWTNMPPALDVPECLYQCFDMHLSDVVYGFLDESLTEPVPAVFSVADDPAGAQWSPDLAVSPTGGFAVVWQEGGWSLATSRWGLLEDPTTARVKVRILGSNGVPTSEEILIDSHLPGSKSSSFPVAEPRVVSLEDGSYVAFWERMCDKDGSLECNWSDTADDHVSTVFWRRFDANGLLSEPQRLADCLTETIFFGGVAPLGESGFVAAWETSATAVSPPPGEPCPRGFSLRIVRGETADPEFHLTGPLFDWDNDPFVFPFGDGRFVLMWSANRESSVDGLPDVSAFRGIMGMIFDKNGNALSSSIPVVAGLAPDVFRTWEPDLKHIINDTFVVTYSDFIEEHYQEFVFAVLLDQNLAQLGPAIRHSSSCGIAENGVSVANSNAEVAMFWDGRCPVADISAEACSKMTMSLAATLLSVGELKGK